MKKHLLQAAERGDAEAQFNLSIMCENNEGGRYGAEGNRPEAMRWLLAAANQGLPRAQVRLAEFYAGETDAPENAVLACGWYLLATAATIGAHRQNAQTAYRRIADRLSPVQLAAAAGFAEDWRARRATGSAQPSAAAPEECAA